VRVRTILTDRLVTRLHYLSLPVAFAGLLWYTRRQWFTEDDWEFIHRLIPGVDKLGMFVPHNEHWSTLPLFTYKALFAIAGLRSYIPYMGVLLALHVITAHLLWRVMIRAGADALVATAIATVFLVLGTGAENLDWAFQIGFVGALAAGLGMVLAAQGGGLRRLALAWLLGIVSVMCSGLGPIMVVAAALTALLRFGWRRALLTGIAPGAVFATWWLAVGRHPPTPSLPHGALRDVPNYMFTGITSAAAAITGLRFVGALLLIPLAWWLAVHARRSPQAAAVVALAATTILFFLLVGIGRVGLGVSESKTSRYVYITAVLLLPAIGVAASRLGRRHSIAAALVVLTVAWAGAHNVRALVLAVDGVTGVREHAQARVIAAAQLIRDGAPTFPNSPEPGTSPDLTWSDLTYLVDNNDLPATSLLPPSAFDTVSVEANVQMTFSTVPLLSAGAVTLHQAQAGALVPATQGCVRVIAASTSVNPSVRLVFAGAASVSIHAPAGSVITAHLYSSLSSHIESPPQRATVDGSGTVYLAVAVPGAAPLVDLPPGGVSLCGVAA
jgi:hypothetical protein